MDTETGECGEQRLEHGEGAQKFYRDLAIRGKRVQAAMEASGHARWFERLLEELKIELWMGDAAVIRAKRSPKKKTMSAAARKKIAAAQKARCAKLKAQKKTA